MSAGNAVFNEQLELELQLEQFAADLQAMEALWGQSMDRMSARSGQLFGNNDFTTLISQVQTLSGHLDTLNKNFADAFGSAREEANATADAIERVTQAEVDATAAAAQRQSQQQSAPPPPPPETVGILGRFTEGFTGGATSISEFFGDVAEQIGFLTRWYLIWEAIVGTVQAVKNGIEDIGKAFVGAFEGGVQFLEKMQDSAVQIRAVLLTTTLFSTDPAKNLQEATNAADKLAVSIQKVALAAQVKPESLQGGFLSFLSAGGGNLIGTGPNALDNALQLTAMLTQAGQLVGGLNNARQISREIGNFINEASSATSPLLRAMGLTKDQAVAMVEAAKQHHDLLQQVEQRLGGIVEKMKDTNQRYSALTGLLSIVKDEVEGAFAKPIFDRMVQALQEVFNWLAKNQDLLINFASKAGEVFAGLYDQARNFIQLNWGGIVSVFKVIADVVLNIVSSIEHLINGVTYLTQLGKGAMATGAWEGSTDPELNQMMYQEQQKQAAKLSNYNFGNREKQIDDQTAAAKKAIDDLISGNHAAVDNSGGGLPSVGKWLASLTGSDKEAAKAAMQDLENSFRTHLRGIKQEFDGLRESTQEALKMQTINAQDAASQTTEAWDREVKSAQTLRDTLTHLAEKSGAPKDQVQKFVDSMNSAVQQLQGQQQKAYASAQSQADQQVLKDHEKNLQQSLQSEQKDLKDYETIKQNLARNEVITQTQAQQEIEQHEKESIDRRRALLQDFLSANNIAPGTTEWANIQKQLMALDDEESRNYIANTQKRIAAAEQDLQIQSRRLEASQKLSVSAAQEALNADRAAGLSKYTIGQDTTLLDRDKVAQAQQVYDDALKALNQAKQLYGDGSDKLKDFQTALENARIALEGANAAYHASQSHGLLYALTGKTSITGSFSGTQGIIETLDTLNKAFKNLTGAVSQVQQGFRQGGVFGGIGAIANVSAPILSGLGNDLQGSALGGVMSVIGSALPIAGGLFSWIGNLFTQHAKNIANDVTKAFDAIVKRYEEGQSSFNATMADLQKERNDAISRLSGKKGRPYLQQILDQIDQESAALQAQADKARLSLEDKLVNMTWGPGQVVMDYISQMHQAMQDVHDYLFKYGGNGEFAAQYLERTTALKAYDLQQQYDKGQQKAVQDALQLNDLYDQRKQLLDQINKITTKNNDSIERREAGAITAAKAAQDQRQQLQDQLAKLNEEITVQENVVGQERQVFNIATNIASLRQQDAMLRIAAADHELDTYRQVYALLQGIYTPGANFTALAYQSASQEWQNIWNNINSQAGEFWINPQTLEPNGTNPYQGSLPGGMPGVNGFPTVPNWYPQYQFPQNIPAASTFNVTIYATPDTNGAQVAADFQNGLEQQLGYQFRSGTGV